MNRKQFKEAPAGRSRETSPIRLRREAEMLTMREAARRAGCSKDTIWRAVQAGHIPTTEAPGKGPKGRQLVLDVEAFENWAMRRSDSASDGRTDGQSDGQTVGQNKRSQPDVNDLTATNVRSDAHSDASSDGRTVGQTDGRSDGQSDGRTVNFGQSDSRPQDVGRSDGQSDGRTDSRTVPVEAHIEALRQLEVAQTELRQLERRLGGADVQMATWRHVLAEQQAELHQLRARTLHLEAKLLELPAPRAPEPEPQATAEVPPEAPPEPSPVHPWWAFWRRK